GARRSQPDRRGEEGTGRAGALDRPVRRALGDLAHRSRRAGAIQPGPSGQRLPGRKGTPAGRLADQAGAVAGFRRSRAGGTGARRHPSAAPASPPTAATASHHRPLLGRIAAMTATLHQLHRPLGSTGLMVSPLGLGTVKLGRDQGVKYPNGFSIPDDEQARQLLALARDLGINLIDTAPAYGVSEERLGPLLAGQRGEWVIVRKVGEEVENGQTRVDLSPEHTRITAERSHRRLRTDRLELGLVQSDGNNREISPASGAYQT